MKRNSSMTKQMRRESGRKLKRKKPFFLKFNLVERIGFCFPRPRGVPPADHWLVRGGIIHVPRTGMPWNQLLEEYGPHTTLCNRRLRWCKKGIPGRILQEPASRSKQVRTLMIDTTLVRAHRTACSLCLLPGKHGRRIGRTRGGLTCRLHVVTDTAGKPVPMYLTAENVSDHEGAGVLPDNLPGAMVLVVDSGCDADWFRDELKAREMKPRIPPWRNRTEEIPCNRKFYESRNKIERCIGRLKDWHRVATRYDRHPDVFLSACALAAVVKFWP